MAREMMRASDGPVSRLSRVVASRIVPLMVQPDREGLANNVAGIMEKADVDGCLVGGASLQADEFGGICRFYDMPVL